MQSCVPKSPIQQPRAGAAFGGGGIEASQRIVVSLHAPLVLQLRPHLREGTTGLTYDTFTQVNCQRIQLQLSLCNSVVHAREQCAVTESALVRRLDE